MTESSIRVAAGQCAIGSDLKANLATCLRVLDRAGECGPDLIVLPEFANHLSWYDGPEHCYEVSLTLEGDWLGAIGDKARELGAFVVIGATLRRDNNTVSGSNILFDRDGKILLVADKQVLIGHENDFLTPAQQVAPVVDTEIGRLGLYMCMDGVINETPRSLGLRGAQMLCNSLNSFAPDEGNLHIPVRAPENRVFVIAANKVGFLVPEAQAEQVSAATNIPVDNLKGAGESQIVAPDGTVLAMAKTRDEEVVFADINPAQADVKLRPDGTDVFASRRPELYSVLATNPAEADPPEYKGAANLESAMIQLVHNDARAIAEACELIRSAQGGGASLIALPGLFCTGTPPADGLAAAAALSEQATAAITEVLDRDTWVTTSLILTAGDDYQHAAVVIDCDGIVHRQGQVHRSERFAWSVLDDGFTVVDMPFGRLAVLCSDDTIYPESFRLLALQGVEVVAVPLIALERWEFTTGLIERAAENRINLLVAAQPSVLGTSFAGALHEDFTIFTEWKTRKFDGVLTYPMITEAGAEDAITTARLHPLNAKNKVVSHRTHLLDNRPWWLLDALTATTPLQDN